MKPKKIKFSIENPCSQDWNAMTSNEAGKFCDHCAKSVIDFTGLSDDQVLKVISTTPGKICGRAKASQLNRYILSEKQTSAGSPYRLLAGLFIAGSAGSFAAPAISTKIEIIEPKADESGLFETKNLGKDSLITVVHGIVRDQDMEPLPGVVIKILDSQLATVSDINGQFKFILPDSLPLNVITLHSEYAGGVGNDVTVDRRETPFDVEIIMTMKEELEMIGLMVPTKKWWQFWK